MGKVDVLLGLQWGDEGKGKIVDELANSYDGVARFQGGPNAGHTIYRGDDPVVLHQIPSSVFCERPVSIIGDGVVLNLETFAKEVDTVREFGGSIDKLKIGSKVNLILPTHQMLDVLSESRLGKQKIGTTGRGIGPVHRDRAARNGVQIYALRNFVDFKNQVTYLSERHIAEMKALTPGFTEKKEKEARALTGQYLGAAQAMQEDVLAMLINCSGYFAKYSAYSFLAEGAQGVMLDGMHGEVPNVTSSHISPAAACIGLGVPTSRIGRVIGLLKAYVTKVGSGVLPTKQTGFAGEVLQQRGEEWGATTGRKRDCGYLDLPALRYAIQLTNPTELVMTKADVVFGAEINIKVATSYVLHSGEKLDVYDPQRVQEIKEVEYHDFGMLPELGEIRAFDQPQYLHDYRGFVEQALGIPIKMISYGPKREESVRV